MVVGIYLLYGGDVIVMVVVVVDGEGVYFDIVMLMFDDDVVLVVWLVDLVKFKVLYEVKVVVYDLVGCGWILEGVIFDIVLVVYLVWLG